MTWNFPNENIIAKAGICECDKEEIKSKLIISHRLHASADENVMCSMNDFIWFSFFWLLICPRGEFLQSLEVESSLDLDAFVIYQRAWWYGWATIFCFNFWLNALFMSAKGNEIKTNFSENIWWMIKDLFFVPLKVHFCMQIMILRLILLCVRFNKVTANKLETHFDGRIRKHFKTDDFWFNSFIIVSFLQLWTTAKHFFNLLTLLAQKIQ